MTTFGRNDSISAADLKRIIDQAWWDLTHTLSGDTRDLERALETEMKDERAHRRLGKGWYVSSFPPSYRVGVEYAAKAFILRRLWEPPLSVDLADMGSYRTAVVQTYTVAARMRRAQNKDQELHPGTLWDKWRALVCKSQYKRAVNGETTTATLISGVVDQIPTVQKRLQQIFTARCEYSVAHGGENQLDHPLFMLIDYSKDIADNA